MTSVLIREVPADDLDDLRAAAAAQGTSLQAYLREAVHAQAVHLRRQAALSRISADLVGRAAVPAQERLAVLDALEGDPKPAVAESREP